MRISSVSFRYTRKLIAFGWFLSFASASVYAQTQALISAEVFEARHPGPWRVVADPVTGDPSFVWGNRIRLSPTPRQLEDFHAASRSIVDENPELFGLTSSDLDLVSVTALPLSRVGSTDKVAVTLRQQSGGIPVFNGLVTVLFDRESGDLLAIDRKGVPYAERVVAQTSASLDDVTPAAQAAFHARYGGSFSRIDAAQIAIVGPSPFFGARSELTRRGPALAWMIDVSAPGLLTEEGIPAEARIFASAEGDHSVFHIQPLSHGIGGKVSSNVNTGSEPPTTSNQESAPVRHAYLRQDSASGTVVGITSDDGSYSISQTGPLTLAVRYDGPYCRVNNWNGEDHAVVKIGASGLTDFFLNPALGEYESAQAAAYHHVLRFRDFIHSIDPADYTMDVQVLAHVNKDDQPCNAFYSQGALHFQKAIIGCTNTAYQDVVQHEEGHLANSKYVLDGRSKPFEEGNADTFAYFINDDPCITDFKDPANCLRNALQTSIKKCPNDGDENCHGGDSHIEGQALASALWAVRERLNAKLGNEPGDALANALFLGWMRAFNDGVLLDVIEEHWLALDDDDGQFANLTPNFQQIHGGFAAYGWKGFPSVDIALITHPSDNAEIAHFQPVTITAAFHGVAAPVVSAKLHYAVDGAAYVSTPMVPTGQPDEATATIPGVASPNRVRWYLSAIAADGSSSMLPKAGAALPHLYVCGKRVPLYQNDFESLGDDGWTHVTLAGPGGQWQRANPAGSKAPSDPDAAYSGAKIWGTDLSLQNLDGFYEPFGTGELRSPTLNLSGQSKVFLQYRRWLAVEGNFDRAQILVNDQIVFQNPASQHVLDKAWMLHDLDITPIAANNASVRLQWRIQADYVLEFGGWNIDDVEVYRVEASSGPYFATYGNGCLGVAGVPNLQGLGAPVRGSEAAISLTQGKPFGSGLFLIGHAQESIPLLGNCSLLVGSGGAPFGITFAALDGEGHATVAGTIPSSTPSTDLYLQFFGDDSLASNALLSSSNGLHAHIE